MLLKRLQVAGSTDFGEIEANLRERFGVTYFDAKKPAEGVSWALSMFQSDGVVITETKSNFAVVCDYPERNLVRQLVPMDGKSHMRFGSFNVEAGVGEVLLVPDNRRLRFELQGSDDIVSVRVEVDALRQKLSALIGDQVDTVNFSSPNAVINKWQLRNFILSLCSSIDLWGSNIQSVVSNELAQSVIIHMLLSNVHDHSSILVREPFAPSATQLQAVEEFIAANWDKPFDIQRISALSGVSVRSLFRHFRQQRGYTPSEFLKKVRLEQAQRLLSQPTDSTTVIAVALHCCFQGLGHFAAAYRQAFGELPSQTLQRARMMHS